MPSQNGTCGAGDGDGHQFRRAHEACGEFVPGNEWVLKDKTIGVLGLAFKQNTDDVRMTPAIERCQRLQRQGIFLPVHDPKAKDMERLGFAYKSIGR